MGRAIEQLQAERPLQRLQPAADRGLGRASCVAAAERLPASTILMKVRSRSMRIDARCRVVIHTFHA